MATLKLYLDTRRLRNDGTAPIKINVTHRRKARLVSIGIGIPPQYWSEETGTVLPKYPGARKINYEIAGLLLAAEEAVEKIVAARLPYNTERLVKAVTKAVGKKKEDENEECGTLITAFRAYIETKNKPATRESYELTLRHLLRFCKEEPVFFEDVTRSWLMRFDTFLSETAKSPNARAVYMRNLRAVFNFAIDDNLTAWYPFRGFKIKTIKTAKRSLPVEELRKLFTVTVEDWQRQYRDFFKLTFMLIGINAVDLLGATSRNIRDGRLEFNRSKTQRLYSIKIEPEAAALLEEYRGKSHLLSCMDRCGNYKFYLQRANEQVRQLGTCTRSGLGGKKHIDALWPDISSYWMRHSWATIAASLDIPKDTIAAALGHGGNTVTDIYIDFDQRKVDEANRRVLDWVLYGRR